MRVTLLRSTRGSNGGRALANAISANVASLNSRLSTRDDRLVVNWGVGELPNWRQRSLTISNSPASVAVMSNKLRTFEALNAARVAHLQFTTSRTTAAEWMREDGKVVVRGTLTGHSGAGIQIIREGTIPQAPLYTRYFKKQAEYRVHVAFGSVILIQQKKKRNGYTGNDPLDDLVRVHDRGWIFSVNNLACDLGNYRNQLNQLALAAIASVAGANHGAVDILVRHTSRNRRRTNELAEAVVCEINSAPALEANSSRNAYATAFTRWIDERRRRGTR